MGERELPRDFWMDNLELFHQWTKVLRYQVGREVIVFNSEREERLYKIVKIGDNAVHLELITELEPTVPKRNLYLCFALLKKDKVEWVLQKGTELGVRHFAPILTDRTEKTGFDKERAQRIVIEAAEQCGRTDIPSIREPLALETLIDELSAKVELYVAEQAGESKTEFSDEVAVFIGPEGGWSDEEKALFETKGIKKFGLGNLTLRAETAAIAAATLLQ